MKQRETVLNELIGLTKSIGEIETALRSFSWDSETESVCLSVDHVIRVIGRYVDGNITSQEVERWANAIECREDVGLDPRHQVLLREIIHELANPLLTTPLDNGRASLLLKRMRDSDG